MRSFLVALALTAGLAFPAEAQRQFFGPNAPGYGPQSLGGAPASGLTIGTIALSTLTFSSPTAYSGTATVGISGNGSVTLGGSLALSTAGSCAGAPSANNGSFVLGTNWVLTGPSTQGTYQICLAATIVGATNSPKYQAFTITGTGPYQGLQDVVGTQPAHYYGIRALSTAEANAATAKMARIRDATTNEQCDVIVGTNGKAGNVASCTGSGSGSFTSWLGAHDGQLITWYDRGSATACDLQGGTGTVWPKISTSTTGVLFDGSGYAVAFGCSDMPMPLTTLAAFRPSSTGATSTTQFVWYYSYDPGGSISGLYGHAIIYDGTAHLVQASTGVSGTIGSAASPATLAAGSFGAFAGLFLASTSRTAYLSGVAGTANTTSANPSLFNRIAIGGNTTTGLGFTGEVQEVGIWGSALSGTIITNACHNQYGQGWSTAAC